MPVTLNSSVSALITQRLLGANQTKLNTSVSKLASGNALPNAAAGAAELAITSKLSAETVGLQQAQRNTQQGTSILQIADGGLSNVSDSLVRLKEVATQAANGVLSDDQRAALNEEFQQLTQEIDRIAGGTQFNGQELLGGQNEFQVANAGANVSSGNGVVGVQFNGSSDVANGDNFSASFVNQDINGDAVVDQGEGTFTITNNTQSEAQTVNVEAPSAGQTSQVNFSDLGVEVTINEDFGASGNFGSIGGTAAAESFDANQVATSSPTSLEFQVGTGTSAEDSINVNISQVNTNALGVSGTDVTTQANARNAIDAIDNALQQVSSVRSEVGAASSRLETAANNIAVTAENIEAARSAIADTDIAEEITRLASLQVQQKAGLAMQAQANSQPGLLLRLLQ